MRGGLLGSLFACAVACGGGASGPPAARPAAASAPATTPATAAAPAAARPLDDADCGRLLDRFLELERGEMARNRPADQVPTDEQLATIRARMQSEWRSLCVGAERQPYDCAMAATAAAGLRACLEPSGAASRPQ